MGSRDKEPWDKFLESSSHTAILRAIFLEAVFIPKECQVKTPILISSLVLKKSVDILIDSSAIDNFISLYIIE
jgi:hypothetical protein